MCSCVVLCRVCYLAPSYPGYTEAPSPCSSGSYTTGSCSSTMVPGAVLVPAPAPAPATAPDTVHTPAPTPWPRLLGSAKYSELREQLGLTEGQMEERGILPIHPAFRCTSTSCTCSVPKSPVLKQACLLKRAFEKNHLYFACFLCDFAHFFLVLSAFERY